MDGAVLMRAAIQARQKAYTPYSGFAVGAALLDVDGNIFTGCNVENAAYTPTICAERAAIASAIPDGQRRFAAIAIVGGKDGQIENATLPCGVCRQVLSEFCLPSMPVFTQDGEGNTITHHLGALLPHAFTAQSFTE